jgi:hypothetical protein
MDEKKTVFQILFPVRCPEEKRTFSGKEATFSLRRQNDSFNHVFPSPWEKGKVLARRKQLNSLVNNFPREKGIKMA